MESVFAALTLWIPKHSLDFPGGSSGKESACNAGDKVWTLGQDDPLEKEMATHPSILAWEIHEQRSLVGYSPWSHKKSDATELLNNNNDERNWS